MVARNPRIVTPLLDIIAIIGTAVVVAIGIMRGLARMTEDPTDIDFE